MVNAYKGLMLFLGFARPKTVACSNTTPKLSFGESFRERAVPSENKWKQVIKMRQKSN
jgi:hypothetical protein